MFDKHGTRYVMRAKAGKFYLFTVTDGVESPAGSKTGYANSNRATRALDILRAVANAN